MDKPKSMPLDEFLSAQSSGFTATIEPIPDKPKYVKVTPYREARGCGCESSIELPREAIRSVTGTGTFHFCCGKRLEVVVVEFAEDASVPVADLLKQKEHGHDHHHEHTGHHGSHGYEGARGYGGYGGYGAYEGSPFARTGPGGGTIPPPRGGGGPVGLVGRWRIPWSRCSVSCIEVCTRFCHPTGWDCCGWETRCAVSCDGPYWDPIADWF